MTWEVSMKNIVMELEGNKTPPLLHGGECWKKLLHRCVVLNLGGEGPLEVIGFN